jgi:poly-gamma-glutamate synthesis protein (capsule biosynthesis protein)
MFVPWRNLSSASRRWLLPAVVLLTALGLARPAAAQGEKAADQSGKDRGRGAVRIVFSGDVMLDGGPGHALSHGEDPFAELAPILQSADIAVCNLECAVAGHGHGTQVLKSYTFKARPECIPVLARYFSAIDVANNHSGDYGPDGFREELTLLEQGHLPYFGGGRDRKAAYRPLVLERNGRRVALLGYDGIPPRSFEAGDHHPGAAWLTPEAAVAGIKAARAEFHADLVIPMLHWGHENRPSPDEAQKSLARSLIDAGADAVIGDHPHVTQTVDVYKGRPIIYSLGNLVFDYYPWDPLLWTGWVVRLTFSKSGFVELETFVVEIDRVGIPHLAPKKTP